MKASLLPAGALPATVVDNNKVVSSRSKNDEKSAKSDFTNPMCRAEEPGFLTPDSKQAFTQFMQMFTKALISKSFDFNYYIWIKTNFLGYSIGGILSQMTSEIS